MSFNDSIVQEFRDNAGVVGGPFEGSTLLLLHTVGAKSGIPRIAPLVYMKDGERYIIFASKAGADTNPDWFHNVKANPGVKIEVGTATIDATAIVTESAERDGLFAKQASRIPMFADYQQGTSRIIPVIAMVPKT